MFRGRFRSPGVRQRILRGESGWWFLGADGMVIRLRGTHVTEDGGLRPATEAWLHERGAFHDRVPRNYSLTVLTSSHCNLGCSYCFQNTMQDVTGGNRPPRIAYARLASETITNILDFAKGRMASAGLDRLIITLFGGEPLLNPRGCIELLARAADLGLHSVSMISNGTLLSPAVARQLADAGLVNIQITFDGDRDDHDRIRARRTGGPTFDTIVRNINQATEATEIEFTLRVNVSHENHNGVDALIDKLSEAVDPSRCAIYYKLVGDVGIGFENDLRLTDELTARFKSWQRRSLDAGFTVPRPRAYGPCTACSYKHGVFGAVVNADGTLSSCWETAGWPEWEVGTVRDGYLPAEVTENRWVSCEQRYQDPDGSDVWQRFQDAVDVDLLDHLYATGRF